MHNQLRDEEWTFGKSEFGKCLKRQNISGYVGEVKEGTILWKSDITKFNLILARCIKVIMEFKNALDLKGIPHLDSALNVTYLSWLSHLEFINI